MLPHISGLFGALKEAIHGKRFGGDEVTEEVAASTKFKLVRKGTYAVVPLWWKAVDIDGDYVGK